MKASERIVFNTAATYIRSVIVLGLTLFSSRWILAGLGEIDFGLFSVVGSLIIFLAFFNSVMASSSARHFAYALGQSDIQSVNKWFNAALSMHFVLAVSLTLIGWPIAEYVIRYVLTIPAGRIDVCIQVFRISLLAAIVNMIVIPFVAMFQAKQRIAELAYLGVIQAFCVFILAWVLIRVSTDRLIFYAVGMVTIHVLIGLTQCVRALWLFRECRFEFRSWFNWNKFKELINFAIWTMIGKMGGTLRNQGSSILINLYFGPAANAAFGIANSVSVQTSALSAAMMGAISPEITAREGRGQRESMLKLSIRTCKFGALLILLFIIPFIMEADMVLNLWLINPPPHTVVLCQLIMGTFFVDKISAGYMYAVNAHGKIAGYQATVGTLLLLTLPLAWLFLSLGMQPAAVGISFIIIQALCSFGRVLWVKYLLDIPVTYWITEVIKPCLIVTVISCLITALPRFLLQMGLARLFLVCITSSFAIMLSCWIIALTTDEKRILVTLMQKILRPIKSFNIL